MCLLIRNSCNRLMKKRWFYKGRAVVVRWSYKEDLLRNSLIKGGGRFLSSDLKERWSYKERWSHKEEVVS